MSYFPKNSLLVFFVWGLCLSLNAQFEKISIRNTGIEFDKDLLADTSNHYVKLMLCGDIVHRKELLQKYAIDKNNYSYRGWFRQMKPLFFHPDFVVGSLRSFFPGRDQMHRFQNSAPDEYLGELSYTGFNVMMMGNARALTDNPFTNNKTLKKLDYFQINKAGYYRDSADKAESYPLVLEKKDIRIAFLQYSLDSNLLLLTDSRVNFFRPDSIRKDVIKSRKTMLADYVIAYIDWAGNDSLKLGYVAELLNMGIDVIIGTGSGEAFTSADLLTYSDGSLKLHVDNIGYLNALSNEREQDKSALIEIVLKKNKASKQTTIHDMGFIPIWTLIDNERYAVLPISNIEEKHIQNVGLNFIQYSTMKVALTDLRYAFYNKIPELHYDYNDRIVESVEQTAYIRRTLMKEQDKINDAIKKKGEDEYYAMFETTPPSPGSSKIPYEDILGMYPAKKSNRIILEDEKTGTLQAYYKHDSVVFAERILQKSIDSLEILREYISIPNLAQDQEKINLKTRLKEIFIYCNHKEGDSTFLNAIMDALVEDDVEELQRAVELLSKTDCQEKYTEAKERLIQYEAILKKEDIQAYNYELLAGSIDSLKKRKRQYSTLAQTESVVPKAKQTKDNAPKTSPDYVRETTEVFGSNDYISDNGTIQVKANNKYYQREKNRPLTAEEKRIADSIRRYNERFIVYDSIAELKAMLKKKKREDKLKRDSIFKASLDPNFRSTYNPPIEVTARPTYRPVIRQGVYTTTTASEEDYNQLPVKNIEEYFCVQVFTFSKDQLIDLDVYPYLAGYEIRHEDNYYRYYIGRTVSPKLAIELCKSIRAKGISDAIVVKYTDGVRSIYKDKF